MQISAQLARYIAAQTDTATKIERYKLHTVLVYFFRIKTAGLVGDFLSFFFCLLNACQFVVFYPDSELPSCCRLWPKGAAQSPRNLQYLCDLNAGLDFRQPKDHDAGISLHFVMHFHGCLFSLSNFPFTRSKDKLCERRRRRRRGTSCQIYLRLSLCQKFLVNVFAIVNNFVVVPCTAAQSPHLRLAIAIAFAKFFFWPNCLFCSARAVFCTRVFPFGFSPLFCLFVLFGCACVSGVCTGPRLPSRINI